MVLLVLIFWQTNPQSPTILKILHVVQVGLNLLLREHSPSWPINSYWGGLYWSIVLIQSIDFLLSIVPLLCLWRSHYVSRPRVAPLPYKVGPVRVPDAVASLIFAKRTFSPGRYSKYMVRILVPVLCASILMCFAVFGMAIACALGMWGSGVTGRSCTSAAGAKIPNCDAMQGSCDPLDPSECLLPFPSSFLLVDDATAKTGKRVYMRPEIMVPLNGGGPSLLNPEAWNRKDGFRQVVRKWF